MKKYLPIILPIVALALVAFLGMRWYRSREVSDLQTPEVASSAPIVPLKDANREALENLRRGIGDYEAVNLNATGQNAHGEVRYQFQGDQVLFSVNANLPTDSEEVYHAFVKTAEDDTWRDLGSLELNKGGLLISDSLPKAQLPITIEIRHDEQVVLTGTINAPEQ
ncbi:hypothetical protein IJJ08_02215 [bacterium]|nr:hypothetical protein [bacterium]